MAKLRIKTTWFRKDAGRAEDETASVLALTFWKMASKSVDDISKADYDIGGPARGFGIIAEMGAFMLHIADRMLFDRVDDERRTALIGAAGVKLAEFVETNIRDLVSDDNDTRDYQEEFLDFLNRRTEDYSTFEFPPDEPNYAIKRYLANVVRDRMESHDQTWIIDQVIEFQAPEAIETVSKLINGFFPRPRSRAGLMRSPFDLADDAAYRLWRDAKLAHYPQRADDLIVEVADPRHLTSTEHAAILDRCRRANMAIYASAHTEADKDLPRRMGEQFGMTSLDRNMLADEDAISTLTVAEETHAPRSEFIPYTNKPIRWHTDGYYNTIDRRICGMILHCVQSAEEGGDNRLLDHEIAYILLRDQNPDYIRALSAPDVMTIPARMDESGIARAEETGPVFSVLESGALHMRYTARTKSIVWKDTPEVKAAVAALEAILAADSPYIFHVRLAPGMGLICNNVLHDRTGFDDSPQHKRVIYRARYHDRMRGCDLA